MQLFVNAGYQVEILEKALHQAVMLSIGREREEAIKLLARFLRCKAEQDQGKKKAATQKDSD